MSCQAVGKETTLCASLWATHGRVKKKTRGQEFRRSVVSCVFYHELMNIVQVIWFKDFVYIF